MDMRFVRALMQRFPLNEWALQDKWMECFKQPDGDSCGAFGIFHMKVLIPEQNVVELVK